MNCPHDDFKIYGSNSIGYATCLKCKKEVQLDNLINAWKARIDADIDAKRDMLYEFLQAPHGTIRNPDKR